MPFSIHSPVESDRQPHGEKDPMSSATPLRRLAFFFAAGVSLWIAPVAFAQLTVPSGFSYEQLSGRVDNITPRIEAIRNPAYGNGVVAASISNGILTVRRISTGQIAVVGTRAVPTAQAYVLDLRFDTSGLFGNSLYVSVPSNLISVYTNEIFRVDPNGTISSVGVLGGPNGAGLALTLDFTNGAGGYVPGAYMPDLNGEQLLSAFWRWTPPASFTQLSPNLVAPGQVDMDVRGVEFDRGGAFSNRLIVADNDANNSGRNTVFTLSPSLAWANVTTSQTTAALYIRDLAMSNTGALGNLAYILDAVGDRVASVSPTGVITTFASGFTVANQYDSEADGAASLSITEDGNTMYVADTNGVWRIRRTTDTPGPVLVMREPSTPNNAAFTNPGGVAFTRLLWSSSLTFAAADVSVTRTGGAAVPFSVSGSGTAFMLISFAQPLLNSTYTITVRDTARSTGGVQIDGDANGIAGGNLVFTMSHSTCNASNCVADVDDGSGTGTPDAGVGIEDLLYYLLRYDAGC